MEFKQLQSFISVVQYKNFTKAASKNYLSQSTISSHIRQLEEELNVQLFSRTTKNVEVTPKGMELYEYAVHIFELKKRMQQTCAINDDKSIYLGASTIPSAYLLPPILSAYSSKHKEVCFTIHQNDSSGVIDLLKEGLIDIGVIGSDCEDDGIVCTPLCKDRMVLITPNTEEFRKIQASPETALRKLMHYPLIFREEGSGSQKRINAFIQNADLDEDDLNIIARIDDQEAIKNLVVNGLGITMLSERAIHNSYIEDKILTFDLPDELAVRSFYVIYKKTPSLKEHTEQFLEYLVSETEKQYNKMV